MMQKIFNWIIAGIVVILLFLAVFSKPAQTAVKGVYEQVTGYFYAGVNIGPTGTTLNNVQKGTCALIAPSFTVAASTTVAMDCAVTGVVSGDLVFANFATSTARGNGWQINGVQASSTSGYVSFNVTNWTGGSAVIPASLASSTPYYIVR